MFQVTANSPFPVVTEIYALWYTLNLSLCTTADDECVNFQVRPPQIPVSSQKLPMISNDFA